MLVHLALALPWSAAHAATWTVDPAGAGDFVTIQAGLVAAADGDTLLVAAGTYPEALDFLGKDVAVRGSGVDLTFVDPDGAADDAVRFVAGEGPGAALSDLTIRNGASRGVRIEGASPTLERVRLSALGRSDDASFHGGGVFVDGGAPVVRDCTFEDGGGWFGGDLYATGAASVRVERTELLRATAAYGGSVYVAGGAAVDLDAVRIEGAFAEEDGGAAHVATDSALTSAWSTFTANTTEAAAGSTGGALYLDDRATWTDAGSSLDGNYGYYGGAVYAESDVTLTLLGTAVTGNTSTHRGGGLHLGGGTVTLIATSFVGNSAGSSGGAVHGGDLALTDTASTFADNTSACTAASVCDGGALDMDGAITLQGTILTGNTGGGYGGGAALDGDVTVRDATFADNRLVDGNGGGGLALLGGTGTLQRAQFDGNDASPLDDGGGLWTDADVVAIVEDASFDGNLADDGGGIAARGDLTVRRSTFTGHTGDLGAAVFHDGSGALDIAQCAFFGNEATTSGGAIGADGTPSVAVRDSVFDGNGAATAQSGGGVWLFADGPVAVTGNAFCGNAAESGGGLYLFNSGDAAVGDDVVAGNVFQGNGAVDGGGAYLFSTDFLTLQNNTFVANVATSSGSAVYSSAGVTGDVDANVFAHGDGAAFHGAATSSYTYNAWFGNTADVAGGLTTATAYGAGTVLDDPLFLSFSDDGVCNDSFVPDVGSPLTDAGDPAVPDWDGSPNDIGFSGGPSTPLRDLDGDGHPAWTDCDDADGAVFPGAADVWYDGTDQDCAGDDDHDQDGDRFPSPADCVDTDAAAHPGAPEVWYDGVDGDCDGGSDFDQDGDGAERDLDGGTDCDDLDAAVSPGATEVWYDGVDQDCSGGSDYDQDLDGDDAVAFGGADCDDADPTRSGLAAEVWYDDVDQDCDGGSDYDQDGDGVDAPLGGGADCDDLDASVFPGADEVWYDGVDGACDGGDDFDQDGDGYAGGDGGEDCDDLDPAVHTGCDGATTDTGGGDGPSKDEAGCGCTTSGGGGAGALLALLAATLRRVSAGRTGRSPRGCCRAP